MDQNEYEFRIIGNSFIIKLPFEARNHVWSNSYGRIQKELRKLDDNITDIIINAQNMEWADPIPMLSLLISIAEVHAVKRLFFVVPDIDKMNDGQKRVYEFLRKEGFISEMKRYGINIISDKYEYLIGHSTSEELKKATEESLLQIEKLEGFVYYNDSTILQAKVVDLINCKTESDIDNEIERELEEIKHRVKPHLQDSQLNEIIWKAGLFLKETINNINEHAYENSNHKYAGYYIRHRVGLLDNTLTKDTRNKIENSFNKEHDDVACLVKQFPMSSTNFLEIYVVDAGIGLTKHYTSKRDVKKSFTEAWRETVGLGKRSLDTEKYTQFGGLYTLGKLLDNEFLIARDYDFWIGDTIPVVATNGSYLAACNKTPEYYVEGLALMCRIAIKTPMDDNGWLISANNTNCFIEAAKEEDSIYEKYYHCTYNQLPFSLSYIKDKRFDFSFLAGTNYLENKDNVQFCFFLPNSHVSKNEIYNYIKDIQSLVGIGNTSKTVIIADIPVCECGLYQLAVENARFADDFTNEVNRIVMISQRLSVRVLTKRNKTYEYSQQETENYTIFHPTEFSPHLSLLHALEWLKTHDSMIVWQYIVYKNETNNFFVNQKVKWYKDDDDKVLNGYLDFEKTLTDSFLKRLYHNSMLRTLCLTSNYGCKYIAEDPLMTGMASYMNTLFYNRTETNSPLVALGSVYVSGATQSKEVTYNVNLYLHKDSAQYVQKNSVLHLFAWPEKELFPEKDEGDLLKQNYRRVGSTYAIAPFGWRYFPIPRYKAKYINENKEIASRYFFHKEEMGNIKFQSVYKCTPKDTYYYWQGKNGVFVGISHVDYETKHDILNINFPFIVKESFLLGGDLACFLLGEIASAFSLEEKDLEFRNNVKFKQDVSSYKKQSIDKYRDRKCSFLIYPYHSNTERIMEIIMEFIMNKDIKIIPLIPLNKERNGTSFQPSPLTIEMLKNTISQVEATGNEVNALFFDDAIIDGKTLEEIRHIMHGLGVKHVMSLFLLERRRIPYNTSDSSKTSVFWRLDIPRLGSTYSCPLCAALNSIKDFASQIISANAKNRVLKWSEIWSARTESTMNSIQTLIPVKLHLEQPKKRFGIYFEDEDCKQCEGESQKIELLSSLGLTLYMGELLSMTSRDDKMLQYCSKNYNLDNLAILEMLCTNLLLYGKTISRKVREKIVLQIFNNANSSTECNNHTAFAALVLMTQEPEVLRCIAEKYEEMHRSNIRPNYDMLIFLSYLSTKNVGNFDHFEDVRRLCRSSMTEDGAYRMFHSELFNGDGRLHNRPLGRLIEDAISTTQDLRRAQDAMDCIAYTLEHIYNWDLAVWCKKDDDSTIADTRDILIEKRKMLNDIEWDDYALEKVKYINEIQQVFDKLSSIHRRLFIPLNLINESKNFIEDFSLLKKVNYWAKERAEDGNLKYDIGIFSFKRYNVGKSHIYERWIIWDETVDEEIKYLILNAHQYSAGSFSIGTSNEEKHKVWISLEYKEDLSSISLLVYNKTSSQKNAEYIRRETGKKTRYGKKRLTDELKIKVDYYDKNNEIIQTKITFPLI